MRLCKAELTHSGYLDFRVYEHKPMMEDCKRQQ